MRCPKCKTIKLKTGLGGRTGTELDYCPKCKGIWFEDGELENVCGFAVKDFQGSDEAIKVRHLCPKCEDLMWEFNYPQTLAVIEMCRKCNGMWLDAGEVKEIRAVRKRLWEQSQLQEYGEIPGLKGKLIRLIDKAVEALKGIDGV